MKITISFIAIIILLSGCKFPDVKPFTKDMYLANYHSFIANIEDQHQSFSSSQWKDKDATYFLYSESWYESFELQLSSKEKQKITKLNLRYHAYKLSATGSQMCKKIEQWFLSIENEILE